MWSANLVKARPVGRRPRAIVCPTLIQFSPARDYFRSTASAFVTLAQVAVSFMVLGLEDAS